jgi:hypothetical protein
MITFHDYSNRRAVLVPLLAKVHELLKEIAVKDKLSGLETPEHVISWQHKKRRELTDINRRFLVAMDGDNLAGIFFYKYDGTDIYLEDVQIAWKYKNNPHAIEGFLKKLEFDAGAKGAIFYSGKRIRNEAEKEILALKSAVPPNNGTKSSFPAYEKLGDFSQMSDAMKIRYTHKSFTGEKS